MSVKGLLLKQFTTCFDENGWFVAVRNVLEGVAVEQAAWKPVGPDTNCIWELLSHLTYYNHAYLQRFKGIAYEYDVENNDQTFSTGEYQEADWQADVNRFNEIMTEWRGLIEAADESKFSEPVLANPTRVWADVIADVNAHNAHHGGQMLLLRKLQGSWNPEKGVS
jgi:hypothetical protein